MYELTIIGSRIRDIRASKSWLLSDLANKTGLSVAHISSIERGKNSFSIISLIKISEALDISVNYLLFGNDNQMDDIPYELQKVFLDCSQYEICILIDNAKSLKQVLRKNKI